MAKSNSFFIIIIFILACSEKELTTHPDQINQRSDGLVYLKSSQESFTGKVEDWHDSGVLKYQINYVSGKAHGVSYQWWDNGQLAAEINFNLGEIINQKRWDINGNKITNSN
tara:strand:- start:39 stop:374 length:336 start_codon:yes stop_codon:yes gene_type:complete